jgi:RNA polymerase sigma factor (sigma-70 family)
MAHRALAFVWRRLWQLTGGRAASADGDGPLLRRFAATRDEEAFAELLRRHGPMVFGVCLRVLGEGADAEDAFQAAFLVLVRRAGAIRRHEQLGPWLHGVAHRLALRARADAARRRRHESQAPARAAADPFADVIGRDLRAALDEELSRLPEKYRTPLVLCYLEGKTQEEAARLLGWSNGSLFGRLARARDLLRGRLARRGLALAAAPAALLAAVPPALNASTLRLAALLAAPEAAAHATSLANGMLRTLFLDKVKTAAVVVLAFVALAVGAGVAAYQARPQKPADEKTAEPPPPKAEPPADAAPRLDAHGDPLPDEALARLGAARLRDGGSVFGLAFTPDGKTVVSNGSDGVRVWDAATGKLLRHFKGDWASRGRDRFALSPDGKRLALPGDRAIHLWELDSGKEVHSFGTRNYCYLRFSPDCKTLAALAGAYTLRGDVYYPDEEQLELWDATTGRLMRSRRTGVTSSIDRRGSSTQVAWVDGRALLVVEADAGRVRLLDADSRKPRAEISAQGRTPGDGRVVLSPDGARLAVVCEDGGAVCVRLWDVAAARETGRLAVKARKGETPPVWSENVTLAAFAADGRTLVTASADGTLIVWDPAAGKEVRRWATGLTYPMALAVSPDGKSAALARESAVRLIDLTTGKDRLPQTGHQDLIESLAVSADGRTAATACGERVVLWDAASGRPRRRLEGLPDVVAEMKTAADGRALFTLGFGDGGGPHTLQTWDLDTGKELHRVEWKIKDPAPSRMWALAPDGRTAVLGLTSDDRTAFLVDWAAGKELQRLEVEGKDVSVAGAAFTPDGRAVLVWSCGDNAVRLWDASTGRVLRQFVMPDRTDGRDHTGAGYTAAVSPDGRRILFGSQQGFLALYDVAAGREIVRSGTLDGGPASGSVMAFAPDGRSFAWIDLDRRVIHLVETATLRERRRFTAPQGAVTALAFSPDGKALIAGNGDTTALVWDLTGRLRDPKAWGRPLTAAELDACWSALAGDDAARAYRAVQRLAGSAKEAVAYLKPLLRPVPAGEETRVARLIADLDSDDYRVREAATRELEKQAEEAASGFYQKALADAPSLEARRRLLALLDRQRESWGRPSAQRLRALRAVEALEAAGTPEARRALEALARGARSAFTTEEAQAALERLARRAE